VDVDKKSTSYSAAGHPPLLLWRMSTGKASEVSANGLPLGLFPEATYAAVEVPVEPSDKAILYTDGIPETARPSEQEFGADLFKGFLESKHNLRADMFADSSDPIRSGVWILLLNVLPTAAGSEC
jgi:phosphoserine phosphatase RsbU/P